MGTIITDAGKAAEQEIYNKLYTRPFCLDHARAGAPIALRSGAKVDIFKWDGRQAGYPIMGCYGESDVPACWQINGSYGAPNGASDGRDLVMTPLGYIDGKPVFVGDELIDPSGATFVPGALNSGHLAGCRWPAPEKSYPVTGMMMADFDAALRRAGAKEGMALHVAVEIANTALRHAIDSGQLPTKEAYDLCSRDLSKAERLLESLGYRSAGDGEWMMPTTAPACGQDDDPAEAAYWTFDARKKGHGEWKGRSQSERDAFKAEWRNVMGDRAAHDLAIAEAVRRECEKALSVQQLALPLLNVDLAAVIAGVQP